MDTIRSSASNIMRKKCDKLGKDNLCCHIKDPTHSKMNHHRGGDQQLEKDTPNSKDWESEIQLVASMVMENGKIQNSVLEKACAPHVDQTLCSLMTKKEIKLIKEKYFLENWLYENDY